jgi:hypothetical protein
MLVSNLQELLQQIEFGPFQQQMEQQDKHYQQTALAHYHGQHQQQEQPLANLC